jgi:hypothetical protein
MNTFLKEMLILQEELIRLTNDIPPFEDCEPFSPHAYNSISFVILESIYSCIEQIGISISGLPYQYNLGIILYKELILISVNHYFREYERINNFIDIRPNAGNKLLVKEKISLINFVAKALSRTQRIIQNTRRRNFSKSLYEVGYVGSTTVSWNDLVVACESRNISLSLVKTKSPIAIPLLGEQREALLGWLGHMHQSLELMIGYGKTAITSIDSGKLLTLIQRLENIPAILTKPVDLIVSGTLGDLQTRVIALMAQTNGIPLMTINHGSNTRIFEEPYLQIYEDVLPDAIIDYGSTGDSRVNGGIGRSVNIAGRNIEFYSRPDSFTKSIYENKEITSITNLKGLRAVIIASGGWQDIRLGPHHDVHPSTYLHWQQQLLAWLENQTGRKPLLRMHPKRLTDRYDPDEYDFVAGNMLEALNRADILVFDYPTTPTSHMCATNKPVLFFDIGLRRIHPVALEAIRGRCYYARTDVLNPADGFTSMVRDLSKKCSHTFVPRFSLIDESEKTEIGAITDAISQYLMDGKIPETKSEVSIE